MLVNSYTVELDLDDYYPDSDLVSISEDCNVGEGKSDLDLEKVGMAFSRMLKINLANEQGWNEEY